MTSATTRQTTRATTRQTTKMRQLAKRQICDIVTKDKKLFIATNANNATIRQATKMRQFELSNAVV
jgi:hypothetical protein